MKPANPAPDYAAFLAELKGRIATARIGAARAVNRELILLYWDVGRGIAEKQQTHGWGDSVVERLARDLSQLFPGLRGFAARSLWNMRRLFQAYGAAEFETTAPAAGMAAATSREDCLGKLRQAVAEIPWGHHLLVLDKVESLPARLYYLRATARFGWSRAVLLNQIKAQAWERAKAEKKTHNFAVALPEHFAEQADEMLKSRYNLEFLGIARPMQERELEERLIGRLQQFILELGYGLCFVARRLAAVVREILPAPART